MRNLKFRFTIHNEYAPSKRQSKSSTNGFESKAKKSKLGPSRSEELLSAGPSIGQANRMPMYCTTADSPEATVGARHLLESLLSADQEEDAIAQNYQPKISPISHNISLWSEGVRADYTNPRSAPEIDGSIKRQNLDVSSYGDDFLCEFGECTSVGSTDSNTQALRRKNPKKTRKQW